MLKNADYQVVQISDFRSIQKDFFSGQKFENKAETFKRNVQKRKDEFIRIYEIWDKIPSYLYPRQHFIDSSFKSEFFQTTKINFEIPQ